MADNEKQIIALKDTFYADSFRQLLLAIIAILIAIIILISLSIYLYLHQPTPITFPVDNEMRVQPPVPLNQPYLSSPDLLQWVADILPNAFDLDFNNYDKQLEAAKVYFSPSGWQAFLNQLNIFANYNTVQANKLFVTSVPTAAPYILREGVLQEIGKYGWWVQMPLSIRYDGFKPLPTKNVTFQVLVVRVSTLNNLVGVVIDNIVQAPDSPGS